MASVFGGAVTRAQEALRRKAAGEPPVSITPTFDPTAAGPTTPPSTTVPLAQFGPGNDLRFTQVNPVESQRLTQLGGQTQAATTALAESPDRTALGLENLKLYQEATDPAYQKSLRDVGARAAAQGRLGAGMTTSELNDVLVARERDLDRVRRGLAAEAAGLSLSDQLQRATGLAGLEQGLYGQEAGQRAELRGERGYQYDVAQAARDNALRQALTEEQLRQGAFNRNAVRAQTGLDIGQGYANEASAASSDVAELLRQRALEEELRRRQGTSTATAGQGGAGPFGY